MGARERGENSGTVFSTVLKTQYAECASGKGLAQHVT